VSIGDTIRLAREILNTAKTIATVGISRDPIKYAHKVPLYLQEQGYLIVPVNPTATELLGVPAYPSLAQVPSNIAQTIDVVQVFRPSGQILPIVKETKALKMRSGKPWAFWIQLGIIDEVAATAAQSVGLRVVMNRCMMIEHQRMIS
jgi:predicted CoA-binding protein